MKKFASTLAIAGATFALAACGSADDASVEATADTVEMPADEALEPIAEEPVEDAAVAEEAGEPADTAVDEATATEAADAAAAVADEAAAAAEAAEEASTNLQDVVDAAEDAAETVTE